MLSTPTAHRNHHQATTPGDITRCRPAARSQPWRRARQYVPTDPCPSEFSTLRAVLHYWKKWPSALFRIAALLPPALNRRERFGQQARPRLLAPTGARPRMGRAKGATFAVAQVIAQRLRRVPELFHFPPHRIVREPASRRLLIVLEVRHLR